MIYKPVSALISSRQYPVTSIIRKTAILMIVLLLGFVSSGVRYLNAMPVKDEKSDQDERRQQLFSALKDARNENEGRKAEYQIWDFWLRDADITSRTLVMDAMDMRSDHIEHSLKLLDTAIKLKPDYAEAYNQRSFVYFLKNDFERALIDSNKALELEPNHFGALSGQAHIFLRQGRTLLMIKALRRAVKIHPWLKERHMLPAEDKKPKEPLGQEL